MPMAVQLVSSSSVLSMAGGVGRPFACSMRVCTLNSSTTLMAQYLAGSKGSAGLAMSAQCSTHSSSCCFSDCRTATLASCAACEASPSPRSLGGTTTGAAALCRGGLEPAPGVGEGLCGGVCASDESTEAAAPPSPSSASLRAVTIFECSECNTSSCPKCFVMSVARIVLMHIERKSARSLSVSALSTSYLPPSSSARERSSLNMVAACMFSRTDTSLYTSAVSSPALMR
mmetsp:Transcript_25519/g.65959  ORF Transcript_25519/g.65959 Transcript_25519/m.65959 type:complete len:230 (+) Transcript_25519:351-1040(+)